MNIESLSQIDEGALYSLTVTLVVILFFLTRKMLDGDQEKYAFKIIYDEINNQNPLKRMILIPLLSITFISLWSTMRAIGLMYKTYLTGNYYLSDQILYLLAWLLTTNLTITLFRAFTLPTNEKNNSNTIGLMDVAIQSIIIGIITFLPRNGVKQLDYIGGAFNWAIIILTLVGCLLILNLINYRLFTSQSD